MEKSWSAAHDREVFSVLGQLPRTSNGEVSMTPAATYAIQQLSAKYKRTTVAIISRLRQIEDPSHQAHLRLFAAIDQSDANLQFASPRRAVAATDQHSPSTLHSLQKTMVSPAAKKAAVIDSSPVVDLGPTFSRISKHRGEEALGPIERKRHFESPNTREYDQSGDAFVPFCSEDIARDAIEVRDEQEIGGRLELFPSSALEAQKAASPPSNFSYGPAKGKGRHREMESGPYARQPGGFPNTREVDPVQVDRFLESSLADERACETFRGCPPEVQHHVIDRGSMDGARNPSALLLFRIRDAEADLRNRHPEPHRGAGRGGSSALSSEDRMSHIASFNQKCEQSQIAEQLPERSALPENYFHYLGVWHYISEGHEFTECQYRIEIAKCGERTGLAYVESADETSVAGILEPDGDWLRAPLLEVESKCALGTVRLRFDEKTGAVTSQFMLPGDVWGSETVAHKLSEEERHSKLQRVLGTWRYGVGEQYSIEETDGNDIRYAERDVSAILVEDGPWLRGELLGPRKDLIGTIRLRYVVAKSCIISQFKALVRGTWARNTLAWQLQNESVIDAAPSPPAELSEEQQIVLNAVCTGNNVFFTGLPGTGKSFTLCAIIAALRERSEHDELAICASTGAAACHIGGGTLHSFLGCGLGKSDEDFQRMSTYSGRLSRAKVLVIDEISMLSGDFMESASRELKKVRKSNLAFGGLQVVLCGDFLQLPPVSGWGEKELRWKFAFQAPCWQELEMQTFELTQNFRQSEDASFREMLQRVRLGELTHKDRTTLLSASTVASKAEKEAMAATTLFCRNIDVETQNLSRLAQLPGETVVLQAEDKIDGPRHVLERILAQCMAPRELQLKNGARVMMLKNVRTPSQCCPGQRPLVNGSLGTVVGFQDQGRKLPMVVFDGGRPELVGPEKFQGAVAGVGSYTRTQVPLKLAWALSVHKSQGATLDTGTVSLDVAFEEGQVYVALSRFRTAAAIAVRSLPAQIRVSQPAIDFHKQVSSAAEQASGVSVAATLPPACEACPTTQGEKDEAASTASSMLMLVEMGYDRTMTESALETAGGDIIMAANILSNAGPTPESCISTSSRDEKVAQLVGMGFDARSARKALDGADGDVCRAANHLTDGA